MSAAVADKLAEARKLVERGWTQGAWARDKHQQELMESDENAVCWCAGGAMFLVGVKAIRGIQLIDFFAEANGLVEIGVANWNDDPKRTQAEVIGAFRKAEELARAS